MYLISRVLCVSGDTVAAYGVEIETGDVERTREEVHKIYECERVVFEYVELK